MTGPWPRTRERLDAMKAALVDAGGVWFTAPQLARVAGVEVRALHGSLLDWLLRDPEVAKVEACGLDRHVYYSAAPRACSRRWAPSEVTGPGVVEG